MSQVIRNLRKSRNLSQKDLAVLLHTSQACISRIENNKCEISPFLLQDMSKLFCVSMDYLLDKTSNDLTPNQKENFIIKDIHDYDSIILKYRSLSDEHKAAVKLNLDYYFRLENQGKFYSKKWKTFINKKF